MSDHNQLFAIDAREAMKCSEYQRIANSECLLVMPMRSMASHNILRDFSLKGVVIGVGLFPSEWREAPAPHYIPHAIGLIDLKTTIIDQKFEAAYCMLHNLCNLLTMMGVEVHYTNVDDTEEKVTNASTKLYNPMSPPDKFRIVNNRFGLKDHLRNKIIKGSAPGFMDYLKDIDQKAYEELKNKARGY